MEWTVIDKEKDKFNAQTQTENENDYCFNFKEFYKMIFN